MAKYFAHLQIQAQNGNYFKHRCGTDNTHSLLLANFFGKWISKYWKMQYLKYLLDWWYFNTDSTNLLITPELSTECKMNLLQHHSNTNKINICRGSTQTLIFYVLILNSYFLMFSNNFKVLWKVYFRNRNSKEIETQKCASIACPKCLPISKTSIVLPSIKPPLGQNYWDLFGI